MYYLLQLIIHVIHIIESTHMCIEVILLLVSYLRVIINNIIVIIYRLFH